MANVLNPEPESITLNTELETPTLEPATELEQPSYESTSTPETAEVVEVPALDADATTEPVVEAVPVEAATQVDAVAEAAPEVEIVPEVVVQSEPAAEVEAEIAVPAEASPEAAAIPEAAPVAQVPVHEKAPEHGLESMDDFSAALAAFEREQAAEAAAVEAYGDKVVSGTVVKQTEKHLVIDVGLKSEGLVPIEQVLDHTGAVKFQAGDVIEVVIEREEPEGGYLVILQIVYKPGEILIIGLYAVIKVKHHKMNPAPVKGIISPRVPQAFKIALVVGRPLVMVAHDRIDGHMQQKP